MSLREQGNRVKKSAAVIAATLCIAFLFASRAQAIELTSPAFSEKGAIPSQYTCDGKNISPPLQIKRVPVDTRSLALIVEDPDAPGKTWTHWVVFNIPPQTRKIASDSVPGLQGINDFGRIGYGGPCPPSGTHRYYFSVYALDTVLDLSEGVTKKEVLQAMRGHVLAKGELVGLYSKKVRWGF